MAPETASGLAGSKRRNTWNSRSWPPFFQLPTMTRLKSRFVTSDLREMSVAVARRQRSSPKCSRPTTGVLARVLARSILERCHWE